MSISQLALSLTPLAEAIMSYLLFEAFLVRREKCTPWRVLLGVMLLAIAITACNYFFIYEFTNFFITVFITICMSFFCYRGFIGMRVVACALAFLISLSFEVVVLNMITVGFGITAQTVVHSTAYQILGIIVSKALGLVTCNAIRVYRKRSSLKPTNAYWALFVVLFGTVTLTTFLLFRLLYALHTTTYNTVAAICAIGLFAAAFAALFLYEHLSRQSQVILRQAQAEQQLRTQVKQLDHILSSQETLRRFRHDFDNLLTAVRGFLAQHDEDSALAYMDRLEARVQATGSMVYTGNTVLDAILSSKKSLAESKSIPFHTDIKIAAQLPLSAEDMCVIFGNALDNAIEACERVSDRAPDISVSIIQHEAILFCEIENTRPPVINDDLSTTKGDALNHGMGLRNITDVLAHYGGTATINTEGENFVLSFTLPMTTS